MNYALYVYQSLINHYPHFSNATLMSIFIKNHVTGAGNLFNSYGILMYHGSEKLK